MRFSACGQRLGASPEVSEMADWCNARLVVAGHTSDVMRFRRLARARPSCVFRPDMLVGEAQELFSDRATRLGPNLLEKKYIFQACSEDGHEHFRDLSRSYKVLRFVYVYGWDGWNEFSYGSHLIFGGHIHSYRVPIRLVEKALVKHGVDDNPNDEWPYQPEIDAEMELMDLAEEHWRTLLLKGNAF